MANLKCTVVWLVFLLAHLDLELVQSFPSFSFNITKCPPRVAMECPPDEINSCQNDEDCEASHPGKGLKCCYDCVWRCVPPVVAVVDVTRTINSYKNTMPSVLVSKCPTSPPSRYSPPGPDQECQNDAICDTKYPGQGLKCCSDGSDFRCMAPVVESVIQGHCPLPAPFNARDCPYYRESECVDDAHCERKYPAFKSIVGCCLNKCVRSILTCMLLVPSRDYGTCPVFPDPPECPPEPEHECDDDQDCKELHPGYGYKCCKEQCERRCMRALMNDRATELP